MISGFNATFLLLYLSLYYRYDVDVEGTVKVVNAEVQVAEEIAEAQNLLHDANWDAGLVHWEIRCLWKKIMCLCRLKRRFIMDRKFM